MQNTADHHPIQRIWKHIRWILSGRGYAAVLSLLYLAIITRKLGPADYGIFVLILTSVFTVQLLVSFNVWQVLVKFGHVHIVRKDYPALARLIRLCSVIDILSACLNILLVGLILWFGQAKLGISSQLLPYCFGYGVIFLLSIRNVPRGILRLHNQYKPGFIAEGVVPTLRLFGVLVLYFSSDALPGLLLLWAGSEMAGTAFFWFYSNTLIRNQYGKPSPRNWRQALRENDGLPALLWASNIGESAYAAGQQLPTLIVGAFVGVTEAGYFRLAAQLSQSLTHIAGFINLASFTEMTHVHAQNGLSGLTSLFRQILIPTSMLAVAIVGIGMVIGKPLILLIAGPSFSAAYPFFAILVAAAGFQLVTASCEPILMVAGQAKAIIIIRLIGTVLLLGGLLLSLPHEGAIGAAWSKFAADGLCLVAMAVQCWRMLSGHSPGEIEEEHIMEIDDDAGSRTL